MIVVCVVLGTVCAAVATWLFSWPEQQALAAQLGETVGNPSDPLIGLAWLCTGAVLAWLRPRNAVSWLLVGVGGLQLIQNALAAYGSMGLFATPDWPAAGWAMWLGTALWIPGFLPLANVLVALYPDGRLPSPRWRWPVWATLVGTAMLTVFGLLNEAIYQTTAVGKSPFAWDAPGWLATAFVAGALVLEVGGTLAVWVMSAVRLTRLGSPERQQLAWLLFVVVVMFVLTTVFTLPYWTMLVTTCLLPVAIAVGVFRYNLLGIEVVIRRGLVYGLLTAIVLAGYLLVAEAVGTSTRLGSLSAVATAAVIAVALAPLRERVQRGVDRLLYGERQDPVRAVSRVGRQLAGSDIRGLRRSVLASVAAAVRAPGAAVTDLDGGQIEAVGAPALGPSLPLTLGARQVGTLQVADRRPGERYTVADLRLLELLAPQLAVVVYALDLADALEAERDHVLEATQAERERLRCDLHDGLGPSLSGVRLGLVAAGDALAAHDTAATAKLLDRLRTELGAAVAEVRRIIDGLPPASLDFEGLVAALRRQLPAAGVPAQLVVTDLAPVTSEVEAAALRIAAEALTNVGKHAHASHVSVCLETSDSDLRLTVTDDGCGLESPVHILTDGRSERRPSAGTGGIGLASMQRRAEDVGGSFQISTTRHGTTVAACLPRGGAS